MDGFTGINESAIHAEIGEFRKATLLTAQNMANTTAIFIRALKEKWASPEAHEKSSNWITELLEAANNLCNDYIITVDKVEDLASQLAFAVGGKYNRIGMSISANQELNSTYGKIDACPEEINGSIAMDVDSVKAILTIFNEQMNEVINSFDSIPTDLSVYDANGAIKASFSNRVNEIKESTKVTLQTINEEIQTSIDSYVSSITQAADNARTIISRGANAGASSPKATMTTLNRN